MSMIRHVKMILIIQGSIIVNFCHAYDSNVKRYDVQFLEHIIANEESKEKFLLVIISRQ